MALQKLHFAFKVDNPVELPKEWQHSGVVGSGDLEVLMERKNLAGGAEINVTTPVVGFENVWALVLEKFVKESRLGNVLIEINDNNATPIVVSIRIRQALADAQKSGLEG